jgi:hypothetical protein
MMGGRSRGRVDCFEGRSTFISESEPASLEEAIDEALAAAREEGHEPDAVFDVRIRVVLREHNQNVKAYSVIAERSGSA